MTASVAAVKKKESAVSHWGQDKMAAIFQMTFSIAFYCIFMNENTLISLKLVPKGPINNIPALVHIMTWCQSGDKPLYEPMMAQVTDAYMCHLVWMSYVTTTPLWGELIVA